MGLYYFQIITFEINSFTLQ